MINETETRKCKRCGEDYFPLYYELLNTRILRGDGYCPDCAKAVYEEEVAKEEAVKQAEITRIRRHKRETCGIPPKFMNEDFSTFQKGWQDKAYKLCLEYAEGFPVDKRPTGYRSLYLWSANTWGTGKTHLSCAIIHRILDQWKGDTNKGCPRVVFLSEPDLFRRIQATYSFTPEEKQMRESEDDIIKGIISADLLVLDDVGKEKRADPRFIQRTMFAIIDGRYKLNLPLIITANLSPGELKSHLEPASFDRVWELCQGKSIQMDGKSYRQR